MSSRTDLSGRSDTAFGLFQTSYIIGKLHGIDIRNYGSGNAGTTNMMRTMGTKAGLLTFAGDCLKCVLASCAGTSLPWTVAMQSMLPLLKMYAASRSDFRTQLSLLSEFPGRKGDCCYRGPGLSALTGSWLILGVITFFRHFLCYTLCIPGITCWCMPES